jgi:hypothetical protein
MHNNLIMPSYSNRSGMGELVMQSEFPKGSLIPFLLRAPLIDCLPPTVIRLASRSGCLGTPPNWDYDLNYPR